LPEVKLEAKLKKGPRPLAKQFSMTIANGMKSKCHNQKYWIAKVMEMVCCDRFAECQSSLAIAMLYVYKAYLCW
jgi:hypothetical protein